MKPGREPVPPGSVPRWLWWGALLTLGVVIAGGVIGAVMLALGAGETPPAGPLRWQSESAPTGCLDVAALDLPRLVPPVTLELSAERLEGTSAFATWGLWLDDPGSDLRWEVLPPGYYRYRGQTFPSPHVCDATNDLRLDLIEGRFVLWLNREQAASGPIPAGMLAWGLVGGEDICWQRLAIYGPS
jgi:hypothetical protein